MRIPSHSSGTRVGGRHFRCSVGAEHTKKKLKRCRNELFPWDVQMILMNDICYRALFEEFDKYSITGTSKDFNFVSSVPVARSVHFVFC